MDRDITGSNNAAVVPNAFGVAPGQAIAAIAAHAALVALTAQEAAIAARGG